jgi:hypothetical protein
VRKRTSAKAGGLQDSTVGAWSARTGSQPLLEIIMNRTYVITLAMAVLAAGHACAGEITMDPEPFISVASRAQVQDELKQFRTGAANPWADDYNPLAGFHSSVTRADVTAEYLASRDAVAAFSGEDSGSSYLARAHVPALHPSTEMASAE